MCPSPRWISSPEIMADASETGNRTYEFYGEEHRRLYGSGGVFGTRVAEVYVHCPRAKAYRIVESVWSGTERCLAVDRHPCARRPHEHREYLAVGTYQW